MLLDHVPGDGEAATLPPGLAPTARAVDLVEALEQPRLGRLRDADPVIRDRGDEAIVVASDGHRDVTTVRAELDRVVEEVHEHLAEPLGVAANQRDVLVGIDDKADALAV